MSPRLRRLSGWEIVQILKKFGFSVVRQHGSHIKLKRISEGSQQTITIPLHKELDTGTLLAIIRQASRFIPFEELRKVFWID